MSTFNQTVLQHNWKFHQTGIVLITIITRKPSKIVYEKFHLIELNKTNQQQSTANNELTEKKRIEYRRKQRRYEPID